MRYPDAHAFLFCHIIETERKDECAVDVIRQADTTLRFPARQNQVGRVAAYPDIVERNVMAAFGFGLTTVCATAVLGLTLWSGYTMLNRAVSRVYDERLRPACRARRMVVSSVNLGVRG